MRGLVGDRRQVRKAAAEEERRAVRRDGPFGRKRLECFGVPSSYTVHFQLDLFELKHTVDGQYLAAGIL